MIMDITISEQTEDYLKSIVDKGIFASPSEAAAKVFELGIQSLYEQQQHEKIMTAVDKGLEDVKAGRVRPFDENYIEELKTRIRMKAAQR